MSQEDELPPPLPATGRRAAPESPPDLPPQLPIPPGVSRKPSRRGKPGTRSGLFALALIAGVGGALWHFYPELMKSYVYPEPAVSAGLSDQGVASDRRDSDSKLAVGSGSPAPVVAPVVTPVVTPTPGIKDEIDKRYRDALVDAGAALDSGRAEDAVDSSDSALRLKPGDFAAGRIRTSALSKLADDPDYFGRYFSVIKTFAGPRGPVASVAWSPDGKLLAAAYFDNSIRLWDVETSMTVRMLAGHRAGVQAVAWSPDGGMLASAANDGLIKLWDPATGIEIRTLSDAKNRTGQVSGVLSLAFSPDGRMLASGGADRTIRLWRVANGGLARVFAGHERGLAVNGAAPIGPTGAVAALAFTPDGSRLASGDKDSTLVVWDLRPKGLAFSLDGATRGIAALAYSANGRWLVCGDGAGNAILYRADAEDRHAIRFSCGHGSIHGLDVDSRSSHLAAACSDGAIVILDLIAIEKAFQASPGSFSVKLAGKLSGHSGSTDAVGFSHDGKWIASAGHDGLVKLWGIQDRPFEPAKAEVPFSPMHYDFLEATPTPIPTPSPTPMPSPTPTPTPYPTLPSNPSKEVYTYLGGAFTNYGTYWKEIDSGGAEHFLHEWKRTEGSIILQDSARHLDVQIPAAGGMTHTSIDNGNTWQESYVVRPGISPPSAYVPPKTGTPGQRSDSTGRGRGAPANPRGSGTSSPASPSEQDAIKLMQKAAEQLLRGL